MDGHSHLPAALSHLLADLRRVMRGFREELTVFRTGHFSNNIFRLGLSPRGSPIDTPNTCLPESKGTSLFQELHVSDCR